ncbi:MAG: hypothetical protein AAF471_06055, partial [Myxococcota bacterium]
GRIPATLRAVPEIEEAFAVLEEIGLDRHELELYRKADMARRDRASQLETSYDKGHKKGVAEGEKQGLKHGLAEGEKKGWEKGREEERRTLVRNLLKSGMDVKAIAAAVGLSLSDIERLSRPE